MCVTAEAMCAECNRDRFNAAPPSLIVSCPTQQSNPKARILTWLILFAQVVSHRREILQATRPSEAAIFSFVLLPATDHPLDLGQQQVFHHQIGLGHAIYTRDYVLCQSAADERMTGSLLDPPNAHRSNGP